MSNGSHHRHAQGQSSASDGGWGNCPRGLSHSWRRIQCHGAGHPRPSQCRPREAPRHLLPVTRRVRKGLCRSSELGLGRPTAMALPFILAWVHLHFFCYSIMVFLFFRVIFYWAVTDIRQYVSFKYARKRLSIGRYWEMIWVCLTSMSSHSLSLMICF